MGVSYYPIEAFQILFTRFIVGQVYSYLYVVLYIRSLHLSSHFSTDTSHVSHMMINLYLPISLLFLSQMCGGDGEHEFIFDLVQRYAVNDV